MTLFSATAGPGRQPGDPTISVIIPTYNRSDVLGVCLDALLRQTLEPARFEVIVVDDGSTDATRSVLAGAAAPWAGRLLGLRQKNAGANAARNRAIACARGALLVIINDDSIAAPELLAEHLRLHDQHPEEWVAVLGRVTVAPEVPFSPVTPLHADGTYAPFAGKTELDWKAFYTCNISVKRSFLLRCGLFDTQLRWHEDIELGQRLHQHGLRVLYNPAALAYHLHYLSAADLLRIGDKEGRALAGWYLRQPALRETLIGLGLRTRSFPVRSWRYRLADTLVNDATLKLWLWLAARLYAVSPRLSLRIHRAAFSARKRSAIAEVLGRGQAASGS